MAQIKHSHTLMDTRTRVLVYKQSFLPLVEYVSFMLYLNNARDIDKLQKLQNRSLRLCFDIYNPIDMGIVRLHQMAKIDMLSTRRDVQLLNLMFSLKLKNMYKKDSVRSTRNACHFEFKTEIVHKDIYSKSPFFRGVGLWRNIPFEYQNFTDSKMFKNIIKKHLSAF